MVTVEQVEKGSLAQKAGILSGDIIIEINSSPVEDVLDYRYLISDRRIKLLLHRGPELIEAVIEKEEYEDIGLEFSTYLMSEKMHCTNKCIFCFIDQMPKGCRESLYFKDDDDRLSFLQGNYITGTNLTERHIQRIIDLHLSPINISVHATEPELRVFMMKNKRAGQIMDLMRRFADAHVVMNAQIVLCKGVNDGEHLKRSLSDLKSLYPALQSCSVVPAGLTAHREGLYPLEPFTAEECKAVIKTVEGFAAKCKKEFGERIFFASDEFYLNANIPLHSEGYYEGCPQFENGVGMIASFKNDFALALKGVTADCSGVDCAIATGEAAYPVISEAAARLAAKTGAKITVYPVKNRFFGGGVTVAGLVTGSDILNSISPGTHDALIIPSVMLRAAGDLFLDGESVSGLEEKLKMPVYAVSPLGDGAAEIGAILNDIKDKRDR